MRRPLSLLLVLLLAAPAALAQSPAGTWSYRLTTPDGNEVESGFLQIPADGAQGRMTLSESGIDGAVTNATTTQTGADFVLTATLAFAGNEAPLNVTGAMAGADAFAGTLTLGPNPIAIAAQRANASVFAALDAGPSQVEAELDLFEPFALPAPNRYRSASGSPGPDYWQQRADYTLRVSLDPATHTVTGTATLRYTNNSPEALDFLWFQLDQNLFREGSRGGPVSGRAASSLDLAHGYRLGAVTAGGRAVEPMVTDTRMRIDLPQPVAARGGTVEVVIPYSFVVPGSPRTPRMGRLDVAAGTIYSMAQWYPRVAVFDDVNGWNTLPYLGSGEFYLNYGDYDLEITVPSTMTVVATGALQNEAEVYTAAQRRRLAQARQSDAAVSIIPAAEVGQTGGARAATRTWRFRAENVRDVAWGASAAFLLDGARAAIRQDDGSTNNVLILSAYPAEGVGTAEDPGWEEATRYGRAAIVNNSAWYPYPYPVAISVASHIGGMEYPMLHFSDVESRHFDLFGVMDHELGHNWFPMIVGSDERRHAWMDEGFNTFINYGSNVRFYNENEDPSIAGYGQAERSQYVSLLAPDNFARLTGSFGRADDEILTYADHLDGREGGWNSYFKPAMGLRILREAVLGPERFDAAFKTYIRRWAYKHPQPADFFRTIENAAGEDLGWFWRGWFDTLRTYDGELTRLASTDESVFVTVTNGDGLAMPSTVAVTFADGSVERVAVPVEAFAKAPTLDLSIPRNGRTATRAELDPDRLLPDVDRDNNVATPAE